MKTPVIMINFKTYESATGKKAFDLASLCDEVSKKTKASIAVCPQAVDLHAIACYTKIPVFAQHMDIVKFGAHTGWVLPEAIKAVNVKGTLINHSEHRLPFKTIQATVKRAKELGLQTIICAKNVKEVARFAKLRPDFVAYEPPKLIGGTVSVSSAKPKVIHEAYLASKRYCGLLVGAGVHTSEDVRKSLELGAKGVLLASGITKAKNKRKELMDLIKGLKK